MDRLKPFETQTPIPEFTCIAQDWRTNRTDKHETRMRIAWREQRSILPLEPVAVVRFLPFSVSFLRCLTYISIDFRAGAAPLSYLMRSAVALSCAGARARFSMSRRSIDRHPSFTRCWTGAAFLYTRGAVHSLLPRCCYPCRSLTSGTVQSSKSCWKRAAAITHRCSICCNNGCLAGLNLRKIFTAHGEQLRRRSETPKAARRRRRREEWEWGEGLPLPSRLEGLTVWGSVVNSATPAGSGAEPRPQTIFR